MTLGSGSGSTSSIVAVEVLYTRLAIVSAKIWGVSNDSMWILQTFDPSRSRSSLVACNGPPFALIGVANSERPLVELERPICLFTGPSP